MAEKPGEGIELSMRREDQEKPATKSTIRRPEMRDTFARGLSLCLFAFLAVKSATVAAADSATNEQASSDRIIASVKAMADIQAQVEACRRRLKSLADTSAAVAADGQATNAEATAARETARIKAIAEIQARIAACSRRLKSHFEHGTIYQRYLAITTGSRLGIIPGAWLNHKAAKELYPSLRGLLRVEAALSAIPIDQEAKRRSLLLQLARSEDMQVAGRATWAYFCEVEGEIENIQDIQVRSRLRGMKKTATGRHFEMKAKRWETSEQEILHLIRLLKNQKCNQKGQPGLSQGVIHRLIEIGKPVVAHLVKELSPVPSSKKVTPQQYFQYLLAIDVLKGIGEKEALPFLRSIAENDWEISPEQRTEIAIHYFGDFDVKSSVAVAIKWTEAGVRYPYKDELSMWYNPGSEACLR